MKKILIYLFPLLAAGMTLSSCSSWIDEDTDGQFTDDKVEDSEAGVDLTVTGVYSKWIYDTFCWGYFPRVLEYDADYISGPDWSFSKFGAGSFQGESDVCDALWKDCYGLIRRANSAELTIGNMVNISEKVKNNAIGEVKFQKAFAYFLLVRAYGDIPVQNEDGSLNELNQPRKPVKEVYEYISQELEQAANLMYKNTDKSYKNGHVNAGSAAGLLAKVYATEASAAMPATSTKITVRTGEAYQGSGDKKTYAPLRTLTFEKNAVEGYQDLDATALYEKALYWAKQVVEGAYGNYQLLDYDNLWKKQYATASEFMFSVGSVSGDATYKNTIHTYYNGYMTSAKSGIIQNGLWTGCTRHWYDLFDHDDYRIVKGVRHRWRNYTQIDSKTGFFYPYNEEYCIKATGNDLQGNWVQEPSGEFADGLSYYYSKDAQCLAWTTKYEDVSNDAIENADANWPFLRYADVLLIYAEALNELGYLDESITYLNKVRTRSNANAAQTTGEGAITNKEQLRSAIIEERAKELACEGDRRWDLIRWGIYLDAMNAVKTDDSGINKIRDSKNLLYPLPATEVSTNPYINSNNPGWN